MHLLSAHRQACLCRSAQCWVPAGVRSSHRERKSPVHSGLFHASGEAGANVHSLRGHYRDHSLPLCRWGNPDPKGRRVTNDGHPQSSFLSNPLWNILEPSRLSPSPPHDCSWYWGRGSLRVDRGSSLITKVTPTRSANGAPGVGCLKWPHTCLGSTFDNLSCPECHALGRWVNALPSRRSPHAHPTRKETLFSGRDPRGSSPQCPAPSGRA